MFALEFVLSICETAPDMLRKHIGQIEAVLQVSAQYACYMEDDPAWHTKEDHFSDLQAFGDAESSDGAAMAAMADEAFDRIATAIGGRAIVRQHRAFVARIVANAYLTDTHGVLH